jgi:hypothetical protein
MIPTVDVEEFLQLHRERAAQLQQETKTGAQLYNRQAAGLA